MECAVRGESIAGPFITCIKNGTIICSELLGRMVNFMWSLSQVIAPNCQAKHEAEEMILEDTLF